MTVTYDDSRGELARAALGIDGTAGDAQDVVHPFIPDTPVQVSGSGAPLPPVDSWPCLVCGLAAAHAKHSTTTRLDVEYEDVPALVPAGPEIQPWSAFQRRGLLWLVNAAVFHPRGFALALCYPPPEVVEGETEQAAGERWRAEIEAGALEPIGWSMMGDGTERWDMGDAPGTEGTLDRRFDAVRDLFDEAARADREREAARRFADLDRRTAESEPEGVHDVEVEPDTSV